MSKKTKENNNSKGGLQKIIITIVSVIIVAIASVLGFGGEDAENVNGSAVGNGANSEVVSEVADVSIENDSDEVSENVADEDEEYVEEISEEVSEEPIVEEVTVAEITFRSQKLLNQHYEKHGIEMGFASAEEYELAAYKVVIHPDALHKIEAEDGDDVYYLEETNEFVVVSQDGYIRTYFNPDAGIDYYNRQ